MRIRERLRSGSGSGVRAAATCALAAVIALPAAAEARPGDIDPSFRDYGKFTGGPLPSAVAVQPDGKTLVLGTNTLLRLKANGRPDKPFGTGKDDAQTPAGIPIGYSGPGADDIALQPDGKILVAGYEDAEDGSASLVVVRHTADGDLDQGFGAGGRAKVALADSGLDDSGSGASIALAAGGGITVGGELGQTVQLARLTADGLPDPTLGGDGLVEVGLGPSDQLREIAVGADGKTVLAGRATPAGSEKPDFAIARVNADGALDPGFSGDGVQTADFGQGDVATGVAVQPDGKVVAAGTAETGCRGDRCLSRMALVRLDTAGEPDPGFGAGGRATLRGPDGIDSYAAALELQPDGKLVVAGGGNDFLLARLNPDGTPDAGFGTDGLTWTPFLGVYPAYAEAIALTPDGGMVVAGYVLLEEFYDELAIARYEGGPGPADADGDSRRDSKDTCPRTFGTHKSGCPLIKRTLKLKYDRKKRVVGGRIGTDQKSGEDLAGYFPATARICAGNAGGKVTLYEKRKGTDRRVDTDRKPGELKLRAPGSGTFYARIATATPTPFEPDGPVELCAADRSAAIRVKR